MCMKLTLPAKGRGSKQQPRPLLALGLTSVLREKREGAEEGGSKRTVSYVEDAVAMLFNRCWTMRLSLVASMAMCVKGRSYLS